MGLKVELSPKQQAVEQVKKARKILILGHKKPDGDMIGSGLALAQALVEMEKKVEFVISEEIPSTYSFLPLASIQEKFDYLEGKLIRIDTTKIPVKGIKYQKSQEFLDIYLDAERNLKFEFIEIKNGTEKPDLIIALDTPKLKSIDAAYTLTPDVFVGVPILNIDHHSGNEHFGAINLVDLSASSTAEILVSLLEALGYKIASQKAATVLLTGIIEDTQSFRSGTTTPKSLTVAAQLLAAGAAQQEIISSLFKAEPVGLLKLWRIMNKKLREDKKFNLGWISLDARESSGVSFDDIAEAGSDILSASSELTKILIVTELNEGVFRTIFLTKNLQEASELSKVFKTNAIENRLDFKVKGETLENVEMSLLKKLADHWSKDGALSVGLWDVLPTKIEEDLTPPQTIEELQATTEAFSEPSSEFELEATGAKDLEKKSREFLAKEAEKKEELRTKKEKGFDPIDNALRSLAENQVDTKGFTPLKEIMEKKKKELNKESEITKQESGEPEIDVFDEEE